MKQIEIKCKGSMELELESILPFQGNLKDLSKENYVKLRNQILELGFSSPFHVWNNPDDGKYYTLDGHQRSRVLTEMKRAEKYFIPKLPCVLVDADNEHQAKKKILAISSSFGNMSGGSLFEFASINNIDLPTLESFNFAEISMPHFKAEFFDMPLDFEEPEEKKDPEEKEFESKQCPNCGVLLEGE